MAAGRTSRKIVVYGSIALLLVYVVWIAGPYLRSIIVRDAAVTSWVNPVASPIDGYVGDDILHAGQRVGTGGLLTVIANPDADASTLAVARAELERGKGRQDAIGKLVEDLRRIVSERRAESEAFARAFNEDLDARIQRAEIEIELVRRRLALENAAADRLNTLASSGNASVALADAASARAIEYQRSLVAMQSTIVWAELRVEAAAHGSFLLEDGSDAGQAARSLDESEVALQQAIADLEAVAREVAANRSVVNAALRAYERALATPVMLPDGAMVWSLISAPGAAVQAGDPIATWIDCSVMLVDVPVSDVELALLRPGGEAVVILEGESRERKGTILLTRGGAATLARDDLAAVSKGRSPGVGQVLVSLTPSLDDIASCPIGLAAHVDFPGIGFIDVVRARLRL